ncbi:helix-turn-helix domain-containing protein [Aquibacillus sediminis]|uniref:helix-turn-helix domain-containing protein n=1 Tax=Aquibacillus sediminis TaxID=2574734 RepID=UPI00110A00EF|nr:helix-turn-helix domain-containing protein [Aquibacillus sediminis]
MIKNKEQIVKELPNHIVNKGYSQIPDCVTMCYDLTTDEKALYCFLLKNFNSKMGYAYPSWDYIKLILNRGDGKVNKTIQGLEEKGLIRKKKVRGKRNRYYLCTLKNVPCINLSEATFYFKKIVEEYDIEVEVWNVIKEVIRSEKYNWYKENYCDEILIDYYLYLKDVVSNSLGIDIELGFIKENKKEFPF